ncbi:MAG: hypothetical protein NC133_02995 [Prevotella sp.]|nr:hypothetical protein [Prevotella sp.]
MQKEDLIKRMRFFVGLTTVAFVVLIVALLVQFGFIAHYHTERNQLQKENAAIREQLSQLESEKEYIQGEYQDDQGLAG